MFQIINVAKATLPSISGSSSSGGGSGGTPSGTASGSATSASTSSSYVTDNGGTATEYSVTVSGLTFTPSRIIIDSTSAGVPTIVVYDASCLFGANAASHIFLDSNAASGIGIRLTSPASVTSTGFTLPFPSANYPVKWYAYA